MEPISGLNQLLQLIRARLNRAGAPAARPSSTTAANRAQTAHAPTRASPEQIKRKLHERITALDDTDTGNARAARAFVETILIWEFGEELLNDPQFTELARDVADQINTDSVAKERMTALLGELRRR